VAEGLAEAHRAYGVDGWDFNCVVTAQKLTLIKLSDLICCPSGRTKYIRSTVGRIPSFRNVSRLPLFTEIIGHVSQLFNRHGIHVVRQTFDQLSGSATVDPSSRILMVAIPDKTPTQISTVYYRAGYSPVDYPTPLHYEIRISLERSRAIKCPSIQLQLAGGKKVQQVLTEPGVLESFLLNGNLSGTSSGDITAEDVAAIRDSWMNMWGLDEDGEVGASKARASADRLVLKPQREGGGNNVYKSSIPPFLDTLPVDEREVWIAMELINTPNWLGNYLVRAGSGTGGAVKTEVVSELGIFGWALFGPEAKGIKEKEVGWLVRTKGKDSDEGGVATGFSVLDSLVLVN
jgi:glutathione synthase